MGDAQERPYLGKVVQFVRHCCGCLSLGQLVLLVVFAVKVVAIAPIYGADLTVMLAFVMATRAD